MPSSGQEYATKHNFSGVFLLKKNEQVNKYLSLSFVHSVQYHVVHHVEHRMYNVCLSQLN